jgi:hypothetical protein
MRYGLGMTASVTTGPKSTALARAAGVLFIVAELSLVAEDLIGNWLDQTSTSGVGDSDESFSILIPIFLLGGLAVIALLVGFFLLWAWRPKTLPNAAFLALTICFPVSYVLRDLPVLGLALEILFAALALFLGIYVVRRRVFAPVTNILFLVAMVLQSIPSLVTRLNPAWLNSDQVNAALSYAGSAAYVLAGLALVLWPRSRTTG